jgi:hypothetical protein
MFLAAKQAASGPLGGGTAMVAVGSLFDQPAAMTDAFALLERLLHEQLSDRPDG